MPEPKPPATPPPDAETERRRLARLRMLAVLDTGPEPVFDAIVRTASTICGTPIALISLIDEDRQWFKANLGLEGIAQTPRDVAFCDHAIRQAGVMQVHDAAADARFEANPLVTRDPHIRFYAGAPLEMPSGERIGTLCVIDRKPGGLDERQEAALRELAEVAKRVLLQREQLEQGLDRAFAFLARAEQLAGVGGWEADLRTRAVRWTEQTARIYDLPPGHQPAFDEHRAYFDAESLRRMDEAAQRAITHGEPWDLELTMTTARGRRITVRSVGHAELENGRAARLVGALQDISDQRAARDAKESARQLLASVVEHVPSALSVFDAQQRLIMYNSKFREVLDFPQRLFEDGPTLERFIRHDAARGVYGRNPTAQTIAALIADATSRTPQRFLMERGGGLVLDIRRSPLPAGGFVTTYTDVTREKAAESALRESEERQKRALDASRLVLWDLDMNTGKLYLSENWSQLLGGERRPTVTSMIELIDLVPPEEQEALGESLVATLKGESAQYAHEHRVRRLDGSYIWLHSEGRVTERDGQGRAVRVTGTNRDISARKAAEAEIQRAREAAEAASRAKTEFLDTMSHEMRTPLNGVLGMVRLLRAEQLTPQQRKYVELADASASSLLELIDDLLDLGKIEAGRMDLEQVPFRLDEMVGQLGELYRLRAREKGLAFDLDVAPGLPRTVTGDPGRLRQILNNLLSNALKFTDKGQIGLSVGMAGAGRGRDVVRFSVSDSGIGIPEAVQARLFTRFTQADSSTTRRYGGTGLGLAIVKQLCEQMGGDLLVQSVVGRGSSFRCELPLPPAQAELRTGAGELDSRPVPPVKAGRILVAEDNPTNQVVVRGLLAQIGFDDVVIAGDGEKVLEAVAHQEFDLILMDCRMPYMDGYEATTRLRADGCRLPIIALTANASQSERQRCLRYGMDDFLTKPLDAARLSHTLAQWSGRHSRFVAGPSLFGELAGDPPPSMPFTEPGAVEGATFDRGRTLASLGGDEELMAAGLASFRQNAPQVLQAARSALADARDDDLRRHLHSLAGSSGMMGAEPLHRLAQAMEQHAAERRHDEVERGLPQLEHLLDRFLAESAHW